jgi:hypothetical protein
LFSLKAARTGIDDLDACFILVFEQNVLWFEVAVNNLVFFQEREALEDLD